MKGSYQVLHRSKCRDRGVHRCKFLRSHAMDIAINYASRMYIYARPPSMPLLNSSIAPSLAFLLSSTLPPNASSHHRCPDGTSLQPSLKNAFRRLVLPP